MRKPLSIKWIYLIERRSFDQMYKFSKKMTWFAHEGISILLFVYFLDILKDQLE